MTKCIDGHHYCKMLQNGTFFCCKCGKHESEPELKTVKQKTTKK